MNHQDPGLIGRIAQYTVAILGIIFFVMILSGKQAGIDGGLWVTYIAFFVSAGVAIVFSVMNLTKKSLIGIGVFAVLLGIAYAVADGSTQPEWEVSTATSKWIGAGITLFIFAIVGAVGAIIYGEITRIFK